jgi:hypothetical protein
MRDINVILFEGWCVDRSASFSHMDDAEGLADVWAGTWPERRVRITEMRGGKCHVIREFLPQQVAA